MTPLAAIALCAAAAASAGALRDAASRPRDRTSLPDVPRLSLLELDQQSRDASSPLLRDGAPFAVLGIVSVPPGMPETGSGPEAPLRLALCQDTAVCCSVHVTTCFAVSCTTPPDVDDGDWVAVFGRLRPEPAPARGRRGVVPRAIPVEGRVIDADLVVPAELLVSRGNAAEIVASMDATSVFARAVRESGLADRLAVMDRITVAVPIDAAFGRLPPEDVEALFRPEHRERLRRLVLHHVLPERLRERELGLRSSVATLLHDELPATATNGVVRIGAARILFADQLAINGLVHLVDAVLLPPEPPAP